MMAEHSQVQSGSCCGLVQGAIYARVSSDQQADAGTIGSQIALLRERVEQDGLKLEEEMCFIDEGFSGSVLSRPALERLRDAAAEGKVDRLYISCPDRLARKCSLQMVLVEELMGHGVELVFLNRALGQTPEDDLLLQIQGVVAEYERAKILERSRRGKLHAARLGSVAALGKAPYGYRYVSRGEGGGEAHYNVQLEEAKVVRQMFEWVGLERVSLYQVCRRLEKQGIAAPKGGERWSERSVWGMLRNPAYKGWAAYGKRCSGPLRPRPRPLRGKSEQPRRARGWYSMAEEKWVSMAVPALVEEELFAAVAEQLEENRKRMRLSRRGARYLLQGLVVCGCCGYACCGVSGMRRSVAGGRRHGPYAYYRCSSGVGSGIRAVACGTKGLRVEALDEAVWEDVRSLLEDPGRIEEEFERRLCDKDSNSDQEQEKKLRVSVEKLRRGMERLIDAYRDGLLEKGEFEPRMSESRERLAKLEGELKSQKADGAAAAQMRLVVDNLKLFSERIRGGLDGADFETRRELIRTLVKRVEIEKEQVRLVYKVDIFPFERAPQRGVYQDCVRHRGATYRWGGGNNLTFASSFTGSKRSMNVMAPRAVFEVGV